MAGLAVLAPDQPPSGDDLRLARVRLELDGLDLDVVHEPYQESGDVAHLAGVREAVARHLETIVGQIRPRIAKVEDARVGQLGVGEHEARVRPVLLVEVDGRVLELEPFDELAPPLGELGADRLGVLVVVDVVAAEAAVVLDELLADIERPVPIAHPIDEVERQPVRGKRALRDLQLVGDLLHDPGVLGDRRGLVERFVSERHEVGDHVQDLFGREPQVRHVRLAPDRVRVLEPGRQPQRIHLGTDAGEIRPVAARHALAPAVGLLRERVAPLLHLLVVDGKLRRTDGDGVAGDARLGLVSRLVEADDDALAPAGVALGEIDDRVGRRALSGLLEDVLDDRVGLLLAPRHAIHLLEPAVGETELEVYAGSSDYARVCRHGIQ